MKRFVRFLCRHEYYLDDIHRFDDELVAGLCHKCGGVFTANCGLNLNGSLIGFKLKPCPTCRQPWDGITAGKKEGAS